MIIILFHWNFYKIYILIFFEHLLINLKIIFIFEINCDKSYNLPIIYIKYSLLITLYLHINKNNKYFIILFLIIMKNLNFELFLCFHFFKNIVFQILLCGKLKNF